MNNRGVSVTVNFALTLVVATMLLSTLMFAAGSLVDTQQDRTVRTELRVIGERLAASLMTADRLVETGADKVVIRTEAPNSVGSVGYEVEMNVSSDKSEIIMEPSGTLSTVTVQFVNKTNVEPTVVQGGDTKVVLADSGSLEVRSDA